LRALKVHLIGIAGTGMGALARLLKQAGHEVRGSDTGIYPPMSDQLDKAGIEVMVGYGPENLGWNPDAVVVGNVCSKDHPEVVEAQRRQLELESFPSMLAKTLLAERDSLVVAGTHGKTTTTSLVSWLLRVGGRDPSFLIGGVPLNLETGAHLGGGKPIVLEGDEYDTAFFDKGSKFLHYRPKRAILTGVEYDHVDMFPDFEALRSTFRKFVASIDPTGDLIVNVDDSEAMGVATSAACNVLTYRVMPEGTDGPAGADYCAVLASGAGRRTVFEVFEKDESLGSFSTQLVGEFNIGNLTAAIAMARREGVDAEALRAAVRRFRGVKKRQELLGMAAGVRIIFDFAHHPTAVRLTTRALRRRYPNKALHVCFEPRSSSSRRSHFSEAFAQSFDAASHVYIAPVFRPEKVPDGQMLDTARLARDVAERSVPARAYDSIEALGEAVLERAVPGDTVLMLSSGSFGSLPEQLLFGFGDPVTFSTADDAPAVAELLEGYGLPAVVHGDDVETLVMRSPGGVVGCVSLQVVGTSAFLFGLAVAPQRRGQGLGWVLGDIVLRRARTLGAAHCYLITSTATDFFAGKLGFSPIDVEHVDTGIRAAGNFAASAELDNAVCMVLELPSTR
jgi:UDP-N-acetylmuramate: L-alanyl-gamma-D-glutamyl-meso-diaminopimelate ligase